MLLTTLIILSCFIQSCFLLYNLILNNNFIYIDLDFWYDSDFLEIEWSFIFDSVSITMLFVVLFISFLVHLYSCEYMKEDPHISRFMSYLSLFTFFMIILITANNFLQMFIGWEGVGLCSYLLINFWYTRIQANKSAIKAMVINRVGDFCLIIGLCIIYNSYKSLDYSIIFNITPLFVENKILLIENYNINISTIFLINFLLMIGAMAKSAQIGLHLWLPDAMEGPTPVSALIHAATMVTAGIFLIIRCSPIFEYNENILILITIIGSLTAFYASTVGLLQNDIKKIIAYSTCSQLGYMFFVCGLSEYNVGFFHLITHAFFKALLFLCAGSVIHAMNDEQDIRKLGGLKNLLPITYNTMLIGSLALSGFPFLSGFYSKDIILEIAYSTYNFKGFFAYYLGSISAFFTAFYSMRLLYMTFLSNPRGLKKNYENIHESPIYILIPLILLSFFSIFSGFLIKDLIIGIGSDFFKQSIFKLPEHLIYIDAEFMPLNYKLLPLFLSFFGFFFSYLLYIGYERDLYYLKKTKIGQKFYTFINKKWYFDKIYNYYIALNGLTVGYTISYVNQDRGWIEYFGPTGISNFMLFLFKQITKIQTGYIHHYALISGIFSVLIYIFFLKF